MNDKWSKREKVLINLKLLKDWYPKNWKVTATNVLAEEIVGKLKDLGMVDEVNAPLFGQLLPGKMFSDEVKKMKAAAEFNELTRKGVRKDTGVEAFKIWIRKVLQKVIKKEFFIIVATNLSEIELDEENRQRLGSIFDGIFSIAGDSGQESRKGFRIDELIRSFMPSLIRNRFLILIFG